MPTRLSHPIALMAATCTLSRSSLADIENIKRSFVRPESIPTREGNPLRVGDERTTLARITPTILNAAWNSFLLFNTKAARAKRHTGWNFTDGSESTLRNVVEHYDQSDPP